VTTNYQLAVHLRYTKSPRGFKSYISKCGGLKHDSLGNAIGVAARIAAEPAVSWINISKVVMTSVRRVKGKYQK
jgi:hypothetical protein